MRARLISDAGSAAAEQSQFFRSPEFLAAEGVTHSLAIGPDGEGAVLPVIVREIDDAAGSDAISPYGYPGARGELAVPPADVDWSETGLVSLFVRDRIGPHRACRGARCAPRSRSPTLVSRAGCASAWASRSARTSAADGASRPSRGPTPSPSDRAAFERAYAETMARTGASERYRFASEYFERLLATEPAWLLLAGREGEAPSAGAIAVRSDGYLHYFLGGTADAALADSPMKNLFAAMISLAGELGISLNLGGGVEPGDSLDRFKQGFANATAPFHTHEVVCDPEEYERLRIAASAEPDGFFPAYRAG